MQQQRREVLEMALVGLAKLHAEIQQELSGLRGPMVGRPGRGSMSEAGKKRISDAQKKRWAQYHRERASAN